jgi:hypothetical protein
MSVAGICGAMVNYSIGILLAEDEPKHIGPKFREAFLFVLSKLKGRIRNHMNAGMALRDLLQVNPDKELEDSPNPYAGDIMEDLDIIESEELSAFEDGGTYESLLADCREFEKQIRAVKNENQRLRYHVKTLQDGNKEMGDRIAALNKKCDELKDRLDDHIDPINFVP